MTEEKIRITRNKIIIIAVTLAVLLAGSVLAFKRFYMSDTKDTQNVQNTKLNIKPLDPNLKKLQKITLKEGNGREIKKGDIAYVVYAGLLPDGTVFDTNAQTGQAVGFPIGEGSVIKGWDEGLLGVKEGSEVILDIPASMAYGKAGVEGRIPPNTPLRFDVLVVKVLSKEEAQKITQEQKVKKSDTASDNKPDNATGTKMQ